MDYLLEKDWKFDKIYYEELAFNKEEVWYHLADEITNDFIITISCYRC